MTTPLLTIAAESLGFPSGGLPWFIGMVALGVASGYLFAAAVARRPADRRLLTGGGVLAVLAIVAFCAFVSVAVSPPTAVYVLCIAVFVIVAALYWLRLAASERDA